MSYYQFTREELKSVVDSELFLKFENEFKRLWPKEIPSTRMNPMKDRYDYEYWAYVGCCERVAILITYPLVKLLYPALKIKLLLTEGHAAIVTSDFFFECNNNPSEVSKLNNSVIFDPISLTLKCSTSWIFDNIQEYGQLIDEENLAEWFTCEVFGGTYDQSCDLIADLYCCT